MNNWHLLCFLYILQDFIGKSDPFLELSKLKSDGGSLVVHRTEVAVSSLIINIIDNNDNDNNNDDNNNDDNDDDDVGNNNNNDSINNVAKIAKVDKV